MKLSSIDVATKLFNVRIKRSKPTSRVMYHGSPRLSTCPGLAVLTLQDVVQQEPHVRGPLRQAAHKIRIPLRSERYIAAHVEALFHQVFLQIAPDSIEHLKLKSICPDALLCHVGTGLLNDGFIVRGKPLDNSPRSADAACKPRSFCRHLPCRERPPPQAPNTRLYTTARGRRC
jgi:hypothetical protein